MVRSWTSRKPRPPIALGLRSSTRFLGLTAFIATFTDGFLHGAILPILPFSLVERSGVAEQHVQFWISLVLASYGMAAMVGAAIGAWTTSGNGSRRLPLLGSLALALLGTILFCFARKPEMLLVARALQGMAASIIYTAAMAMVVDSVPPDETGSWIGFVMCGMNLGVLIAPFLAGIIYDNVGYYAVFALTLGLLGFDLALRLLLIEPSQRPRWHEEAGTNQPDLHQPGHSSIVGWADRTDDRHIAKAKRTASDGPTGEPNERSTLLPRRPKPSPSGFAAFFPTLAALLGSSRLKAAIFGAFIWSVLVISLDTVLPLFVKRTFHWTSTGGGLIFLTVTVPSLLSPAAGWLSDRYGSRSISLVGIAINVPAFALLGLITSESIVHKVLLGGLLVAIGIALNCLLSPLAADIFHEAGQLAQNNPDIFDQRGAFVHSYSLFAAATGLAMTTAPIFSGFLYDQAGWLAATGSLALLCASAGLPIYQYTGRAVSKGLEGDAEAGNGIAPTPTCQS